MSSFAGSPLGALSVYAHSEPGAQEFVDIDCFMAQIPADMEEGHRPLIPNLSLRIFLKKCFQKWKLRLVCMGAVGGGRGFMSKKGSFIISIPDLQRGQVAASPELLWDI